MALQDFLGRWKVKEETPSEHEAHDHRVTIRVTVGCEDGHGAYPALTYHSAGPERLEGRYTDGHTVTFTRRADGQGIDCKITGGSSGGIDTGSWTATDPGPPLGGGE
jgi:hypothetical protein